VLGAAQLALLASVGVAEPRCVRRPRVAILSTGDELVDVSATPGPVQIRDANGPALAALVAAHGGEVVRCERVADDRAALDTALAAALATCDLLLVSGGVSVGDHDLVRGALDERGLKPVFESVAIRPGKPAVCGTVGATLFLGLPGNPISTIVTFMLLGSAALSVLAGASPRLPLGRARLGSAHRGKALALTQLIPATLSDDGGTATALAHQGSGDLFALARADAWIIIESGSSELPAGSDVPVLHRE
jgi:molybdopterin molybdotransferase